MKLKKTKNFLVKKLIKKFLIIIKNRNTIKEYKISDILRPKKVFLFNSARRLFKESRVIIKVQFLF